MRQLLILGFYCEVYRREPLCRVYVNDILIDEFNIPHTPCTHNDITDAQSSSTMLLGPNFFDRKKFLFDSGIPFLKYIEFDDSYFEEVNIRIEILNDDNNYSNGFMTKGTRIMLPFVFLLSKKVLCRINDIKNNWKFSNKSYRLDDKKNIDIFYSGRKNHIFANLGINMISNFPDVSRQQRPAEKIKPYCNNWQDLPSESYNCPAFHWFGSSGYFYLTAKKKLGFWRHSTDLRKGRWKIGIVEAVKYIYDKYKQYENPRSTDT